MNEKEITTDREDMRTTEDSARSANHAERVDWKELHEQLVSLAQKRSQLDAEEGTLLLAALRCRVHEQLGYATFLEYVERLFGYGPRFVHERLRVARALESLPQVRHALEVGELTWSGARELSRVATAATQRAWVNAAQGKTVRQLEKMVSGLQPGAEPGELARPEVRRRILRFEVSADTYATYREAASKLRGEGGGPLDEDDVLLLMARHVLEGPSDSGRSGYQVALTVCEHCKQGTQDGRGEAVSVGAEVIEMAACDAQILPQKQPRETSLATDTDTETEENVTHVGQLSPAPTFPVHPKHRATQTLPPALRRRIMRREGGCCSVPGCRCATFLDIHHVIPRCEGGQHDPEWMLVVCSAHHRALHRGALIIEGRASTGFRFLHADGTVYGHALEPQALEASREAFLALRQLGFAETAVREALKTAQSELAASDAQNTGELTRAALRLLTSSRRAAGSTGATSSAANRTAYAMPSTPRTRHLEVREPTLSYRPSPRRERETRGA